MSDSIDLKRLKKTGRPPVTGGQLGSALGASTTRSAAEKRETGLWALLNKDMRLFGSGLPDKLRESFYLELSVLLSAGLDIRAALELIKNEQAKKKHRIVFDDIARQIVSGSTLSAALKRSSLFSPYEYFSIQIGEETGKLTIVLGELAIYFKKKIDQQRQIVGALTYPVLVLTVAGFAVAFMMTYVVPMFADVLKRFGGDLPLVTRMVMHFSRLFRDLSLPLLLSITGLITVMISQRKKSWYRKYTAALILRVPMIGDLIRKTYLSRFGGTMSLLIGSRIPMLQSIELVSKMVGFYPIERTLPDISGKIMSGCSLHESLACHPVYPAKMVSLVRVGEEVNQLDIFFSKICQQYAAEVEHRTNVLSKFLEPLIIVILGLVVGVILIAMYLPMFKLGQTV